MSMDFILPDKKNVYLTRHERVLETNYQCYNCEASVRKYINTNVDEITGRYICNCVDEDKNPTGPQFPMKVLRK